MKILCYGAGVIGSIFAAKLQQAGHDVTVLARGQRLSEVRQRGIVLTQSMTGAQLISQVNVVDRLAADDSYDWVIVMMRRDQVASILSALAANRRLRNILFMVNTAAGYEDWIQAVGKERLLTGFPGAGGTRDGAVIRYIIMPKMMQATTLGELDGRVTPRLMEIASAFRHAGFPVSISRNMEAWQKSHVAWITPISNALYRAAGDNHRLARMPDALQMMVRAIRENFHVLHTLRLPLIPFNIKTWTYLPEPLLVMGFRQWINTRSFASLIASHANAARGEMKQLTLEFMELSKKAGVPTPAADKLARFNV